MIPKKQTVESGESKWNPAGRGMYLEKRLFLEEIQIKWFSWDGTFALCSPLTILHTPGKTSQDE